jgi:hypothetical protein
LGLNSGYQKAENLGILVAFVIAQDEYRAGVAATNEFLRVTNYTISNSVFINHQKGNLGLEDHRKGFHDTICEATGATVDELVRDGGLTDTQLLEHTYIYLSHFKAVRVMSFH